MRPDPRHSHRARLGRRRRAARRGGLRRRRAATRSATSPRRSARGADAAQRSVSPRWPRSATPRPQPRGAFGRMAEASAGKDSVTGHWELMGLVLPTGVSDLSARFPGRLIAEFERRIGRKTLANKPASGTAILDELGRRAPAHRVAHRLHVGRQRLSDRGTRRRRARRRALSDVRGRVRSGRRGPRRRPRDRATVRRHARPFHAHLEPAGLRARSHRRDAARSPARGGHPVVGIGKIEDLFGGRGLTKAIHTVSRRGRPGPHRRGAGGDVAAA